MAPGKDLEVRITTLGPHGPHGQLTDQIISFQEESPQPRTPLSLFPNLYYPPGSEGGGVLFVLSDLT